MNRPRSHPILFLAVAALFAVGCVEAPTEPELLSSDLPLMAALHSLGPVVASATGSGSIDNALRTFAFNARLHADGTVKGAWQRVRHDTNRRSNGRVTCATFIGGNTAFIGGIATSGVLSDPGFNGVGWAVLDGGEGKPPNGDLMTLQFVGLTPAQVDQFCNLGLGPPAVFLVFQGNIQVTDGQVTNG